MKFFLVLSAVLAPAHLVLVGDNPTSEVQKSRGERTGGNGERSSKGKIISVPTVKCTMVGYGVMKLDSSDHEDCESHCKSLHVTYVGGECVNNLCMCKMDIAEIIRTTFKKSAKPKSSGRRVKCANLIRFNGQEGSENHKGCKVHCRLRKSENKDGKCIEGYCHCMKETPLSATETSDEVTEKPQTLTDEPAIAVTCSQSDERRDEACLLQCQSENYDEGKCLNGSCLCRSAAVDSVVPPALEEQRDRPDQLYHHHQIPDNATRRPRKKCEQATSPTNEEICRSYCREYSKDHKYGRCVNGICECGYAVVETMEDDFVQDVTGDNHIATINPLEIIQRVKGAEQNT